MLMIAITENMAAILKLSKKAIAPPSIGISNRTNSNKIMMASTIKKKRKTSLLT